MNSAGDVLILVDVDGPLNPWAAKPQHRPDGYVTHRLRPAGFEPPGKPLRVWLNPVHGPALIALGGRIVWATTWRADAPRLIAPLIGLPEGLDWIDFQERGAAASTRRRYDPPPLHKKTQAVARYCAGQTAVWLDDEVTDTDREYLDAHHDAPHLLHAVNPRTGLTAADFDTVAAWIARVAPL